MPLHNSKLWHGVAGEYNEVLRPKFVDLTTDSAPNLKTAFQAALPEARYRDFVRRELGFLHIPSGDALADLGDLVELGD